MANAGLAVLLRHVRELAQTQQLPTPDAQLLERFARDGDEAAFATLMHRHGPLVLGVCRRVLRHEQDAEDVFQATFLVLARKAAAVRKRSSVGSWLYGVAYRLALRARSAAARRAQNDKRAAPTLPSDPSADLSWGELREMLDAELARLPERYRAPLLLCYFDGLTQDEAARQLRWKPRTVRTCLDRGRKLLRARLERRGLTLSSALATPLLMDWCDSAGISTSLLETTVHAAKLFAVWRTGVASAQAIAIARAGMQAMFLARLRTIVVVLSLLTLLAGGTGFALHSSALNSAEQTGPAAADATPPARVDFYGDPLPAGASLRLGTTRFRLGGYYPVGSGFLPDSTTLVTATSEARAVQLWDAGTGRQLRAISTGDLPIRRFALAPDGKQCALSGFLPTEEAHKRPDGAIRVFDLATGRLMRNFSRQADDVDYCALAFAPDGKLLFTLGGNGILRVEEVASGTEILRQQFPTDNGPLLAVSPDGRLLAVSPGQNQRKLYLWKWQAGEEPHELKQLDDFVPVRLGFSPDGKTLAGSSDRDETVFLWDANTGGRLARLSPQAGSSTYSSFAFSRDSKLLVVGDYGNAVGKYFNGGVRIWSLDNRAIVRHLTTPGEGICDVSISSDARWVAACSSSVVHVWDLRNGVEVAASQAAHRGQLARLAISSPGLIASASDDHTVRLWDLDTGKPRGTLEHGHWVRGIAFSPDGTLLASCGLDDALHLWDTMTGREIYRLPGHGTSGSSRALAFTPDGQRFLSWGDDFNLRTWDVRTGKALAEHRVRPSGLNIPDEDDEQERRHQFPGIWAAGFSRDSRLLLLPVLQDLCVFDTATGTEIKKIKTEEHLGERVAISPDGKYALCYCWGDPVETKLPDGSVRSMISKTRSLRMWDLTTGSLCIREGVAERGAGPVAFAPDGKLFATASEWPHGKIRIWNALTGKQLWDFGDNEIGVNSLAFSLDGKRLVSGMQDTTLLVWEVPVQVLEAAAGK